MKHSLALYTSLLAAVPYCHAASLLTPGDFIIAINENVSNPNSSYPGGEPPANAIDGTASKYLNGGNAGTGFIVTPASGPAAIQSFVIQTGNDANYRDPAKYQIWGTNDAVTSADNSDGSSENWVLISSGALNLTNDRNANSDPVSFANETAYSSYKVVFPETKYITGQQALQINEFTAYTGTGGTGTSVFSPGDSIIAIDTPVSTSWHRHPGAYWTSDESAAMLIDGSSSTKHMNYGGANSGFIVTPSVGQTVVEGFTVTTANDASGRDPVGYLLYGTNDSITTENNGFGTEDGDIWTLISAGNLALTDDRFTESDLISVDNDEAYTSYKMVFTSLKDDGTGLLQISEIQFFGVVPEPSTALLSGIALLGLGLRRRR